MKYFSLFFFCLLSLQALAESRLKVLQAVKNAEFELAAGSQVLIEDLKRNDVLKGLFLGRMVNHPVYQEKILLMEEKSGRVLLLDTQDLRSPIPKTKMQSLISTIDQTGETCAAYAIYHYWQQSHELSAKGSGELKRVFSQEFSRMKLLEESITRYYMGRTHNLNLILNKFGERFGFKCRDRNFKNNAEAIEFIFQRTLASKPLLMEYNIGPRMAVTPHVLMDYESGAVLDSVLWVPRKAGEKNSGGHAIVGAAAFMHKGKKKLLVLDSNWNEPRVWDMEEYLGNKTAISEMIFHACDAVTGL